LIFFKSVWTSSILNLRALILHRHQLNSRLVLCFFYFFTTSSTPKIAYMRDRIHTEILYFLWLKKSRIFYKGIHYSTVDEAMINMLLCFIFFVLLILFNLIRVTIWNIIDVKNPKFQLSLWNFSGELLRFFLIFNSRWNPPEHQKMLVLSINYWAQLFPKLCNIWLDIFILS
jgi:hypothetical protein